MLARQTGLQRVLILLGFLFVVMALATIRIGVVWFTPPPYDMPVTRVDPNEAPWHELAELPGIGEKTARAIVEYRETVARQRPDETSPVFTQAADLTKVHGIGPKTIAKIAPYLRIERPVRAG